MSASRIWRHLSLLVVVLLALLLFAPVAAADNPNPRVLPPRSHYGGKSYREWSIAWWQWAWAQPVATNALLQSGAVDCAAGRRNKHVWFLAGTFNTSDPLSRSCTIPTGTALFFPVVNGWYDNVGLPPTTYPASELAGWLGAAMDGATGLHATLKNNRTGEMTTFDNLTSYRASSRGFYTVTVPTPPSTNLYSLFATTYPGLTVPGTGWPSATVPQVSDGYWLLLAPLPPGNYTLKFGGVIPDFGATVDVTYNITVVPAGQHER